MNDNDQHIVLILVIFTVLIAIFTFSLFAYLWKQKQKQNAHYQEREKLHAALLEEREHAMNVISTEIHDHLSQLLSFGRMNLKAACEQKAHAATINLVWKADKLFAEAGSSLQNMGRFLSSEYVKRNGLLNTLNKELEFFTSEVKPVCNLEVEGKIKSFDPQKELLIYRIAQEAIHNAIRHAKASEITVLLHYNPLYFTMKITDNGVGFQYSNTTDCGLGILNMHKRAALLQASLFIDTSPQHGTTISLKCPA